MADKDRVGKKADADSFLRSKKKTFKRKIQHQKAHKRDRIHGVNL